MEREKIPADKQKILQVEGKRMKVKVKIQRSGEKSGGGSEPKGKRGKE